MFKFDKDCEWEEKVCTYIGICGMLALSLLLVPAALCTLCYLGILPW
jgi:hypothetical protein